MLDALTIQRVTLPDIPLWIPDGSCEVLPKPPWVTIISVLEGSRMSRQDVPSTLRKWVLVRHMHKSLVQLLDFFPSARLPWHQESCSTQDLQQACPIVEASTARQYGKDLEQDSEGVSELPPSTDEVEHFGGCLDELTDAMSVLIESLIEEADLVHEWGITSQCSQLDEEVPMHLPDEHTWAKPSKSEPMSYQDLCILKAEIAQFGLDAQLNTHHPLPGDYEDIGIMALLGEPGDEGHLCEVPLHVQDRCPSTKVGGGTNLTSDLEATKEHILGSNLPLEFQGILLKYIQAFGDLPEPGSVEKLIQMDLRLKPEFANKKLKCRPYPCSEAHMKEIQKQVEECVRRNVVEELQHGETPTHCSPCFLVPKPRSTALRLVVDSGRLNKLTYLHAGSLPNMERTLECMARSKFKSKIDMRSGFWQVELTPEAQRLTAFITPEGRIFRWNNFNSLYQVDTEELARKAFQKMDTQLDLGMEKVLDLPTNSWNLDDYSSDDYYHGIIVASRNKPVLFQDRSMWVIVRKSAFPLL